MRARVENVLGCLSAEIEVAPIALLVGRNASGKSSICRAVGAALSGTLLPHGIKKSQAGVMVRSGAAAGLIRTTGDSGEGVVTYPKAVRETAGRAPFAGEIAAGVVSFHALSEQARIAIVRQIAKADPDKSDLTAAFGEAGCADYVDRVWDKITSEGWDAAWTRTKERGQEVKGQWRQVTGEIWGSAKGEGWTPAGWTGDEYELTEEEHEERIKELQAKLEELIRGQAVDQEKLAQGQALIESIPTIKTKLAESRREHTTDCQARERLKTELDNAKPSDGSKFGNCPHCNKPLVYYTAENGQHRFRVADRPADLAEAKERQNIIVEKTAELKEAEKKAEESRVAVGRLMDRLDRANSAKVWIEKYRQGANSSEVIDAARIELDTIRASLARWRQYSEARVHHNTIVGNAKMMAVLAPEGLRAKKLNESLGRLNNRLAEFAAIASWLPPKIYIGMTVTYGGRDTALCSESERHRAMTLIQILVAEYEGADAVVIDGADVLDTPGRGGLFKVLNAVGIPAIVGMTASPNKVPPLHKMGAGKVYLIRDGVAQEYGL